jgi:hypothetical protein
LLPVGRNPTEPFRTQRLFAEDSCHKSRSHRFD